MFSRKPKTPVIPVSPASVEHEQLTSLINSMADGVIAVDQDMKIVFYNGAALNVLDMNSSMHDKQLGMVLKPIDRNKQEVDIEKMVQAVTIPTTSRDLLLPYSDGSTINLYLSIAPVHLGFRKNGTGKSGYIVMLRDITREKSLEEERDEFISVVSHELRTPIAISEGNISNAQFIADRTGDIEQIKIALKEAHDQILFLASMINDLATLSRAERGKLNVEVETIDVQKFVQDLVQNYAPNAKEKNLELKIALDPKALTLKSSKLYTQEVLQNFITNAIKYTEKGSVTIGAKPAVKGDTGIIFTVSDTGIGISKPDQEKIFDKFFRSEDYRTRQNSGTGLGLYVTMKLARLLHAEITVESELNHGSTFSVFIPDLQQ